MIPYNYRRRAVHGRNRVKLILSGEQRWVSANLDRDFSGTRSINESYFKTSKP